MPPRFTIDQQCRCLKQAITKEDQAQRCAHHSDLMNTPPIDNWMIERADFPLFEINFHRRGKLNEKAVGGIFSL